MFGSSSERRIGRGLARFFMPAFCRCPWFSKTRLKYLPQCFAESVLNKCRIFFPRTLALVMWPTEILVLYVRCSQWVFCLLFGAVKFFLRQILNNRTIPAFLFSNPNIFFMWQWLGNSLFAEKSYCLLDMYEIVLCDGNKTVVFLQMQFPTPIRDVLQKVLWELLLLGAYWRSLCAFQSIHVNRDIRISFFSPFGSHIFNPAQTIKEEICCWLSFQANVIKPAQFGVVYAIFYIPKGKVTHYNAAILRALKTQASSC